MTEEVQTKKTRSKKCSHTIKNSIKKPAFKYLLLVILIGAAGYGLFYAGQQDGIKKQKAIDAKKVTSSVARARNNLPSSMSRKTFIGTITSIKDTSIEIALKTGEQQTLTINDETRITGSDAKKTDDTALKKDQKVIVSSTKNKDGSYTATRIRIQK